MKCYIYKIINKLTGEKYVGQTTNFSRRINTHLSKLEQGIHENEKLQNSWNKYGKDNFEIVKEQFDLTKEELNQKEISEIEKEDSFNNGFNLTLGGDGGNTRGKIEFDTYCFIYLGNQKFKGMTNRTAKYLNIDSSTVSAIVREVSYTWYKNRLNLLPEDKKEKILQDFITKLNINTNPPRMKPKNLTDDQVIDFLCVISTYTRGAEAAMTRFLNRSKGLKHHIIKGEYLSAKEKYQLLTDEQIQERGIKCFTENNLQQYCTQTIIRSKTINRVFS